MLWVLLGAVLAIAVMVLWSRRGKVLDKALGGPKGRVQRELKRLRRYGKLAAKVVRARLSGDGDEKDGEEERKKRGDP